VSALTAPAREFLDSNRSGVLCTVSPAGRPRQSVVYYAREGEHLLISTESKRHKARDVARTGWASLCVVGPEQPYPAVTVAGPAEIITQDIGRATAAVAQRMMGAESPPEAQSDEALAAVDRVILRLKIEHVGPVNYVADA
jgi:PPOX class probable F420-dependent enzyme